MRDSLFNHLTILATADITVTRQLALALTDLALQMTSWVGVVNDIIERFKNNLATIPVLLEILKVLPEEVHKYISLNIIVVGCTCIKYVLFNLCFKNFVFRLVVDHYAWEPTEG